MNRPSKILCSTDYLQLKETPSFNGKFQWSYAHRPNATDVVVIVPVFDSENARQVLFLKTQRPPLLAEGKSVTNIELPAGMVGDVREGESVMNAIETELLEETGLKACRIEISSKKVASSAGCLSETSTIAIAYINDKQEKSTPVSDGGVILERIWIEEEKIYDWLQEEESTGSAISAQALAGLFYLCCKPKK